MPRSALFWDGLFFLSHDGADVGRPLYTHLTHPNGSFDKFEVFYNFILPKILHQCDLSSQNSLINCPLEILFPRLSLVLLRVAGRCLQNMEINEQ